MKSFTPPRSSLNEGLNGGSDDDGDHPNHPIDLNKSVFPEPRAIAAQARLRRLQFRSKNRLAQAVESKLHMSDNPDEDDDYESDTSVTKKMKLEDGSSSAYHGAASTSPPPSPPPYPPPSPPPPPPSPPSPPPPPPSSPPPTPPPPPPADSS